MLFDVRPKKKRSELYNRQRELNEIIDAVDKGENLVVIHGIRRIGKTSLVRVALEALNAPQAFIDVRELYFSEGTVTMHQLVRRLIDDIRRHMKLYEKLGFDIKEALKRVRKLNVRGYEIELEPTAKINLADILEQIDRWCEDKNTRFLLVFDEAQYLRFSNTRYDGLIAWAMDNLDNIIFILTGSEVGVLRDFLRLNDPEAPLYGRHMRSIYLDRFTPEESLEFLTLGFNELGQDVNVDELREVVKTIDGLVGWLTYYGYYRAVRSLSHSEALAKVLDEGSRLVLSELDKVIAPSRERYLTILRAVSHGINTWSEIKAYVTLKSGRITDARLSALLRNLVRYGYLAKEGGKYRLPDPVLEYALKNM